MALSLGGPVAAADTVASLSPLAPPPDRLAPGLSVDYSYLFVRHVEDCAAATDGAPGPVLERLDWDTGDWLGHDVGKSHGRLPPRSAVS